MSSKDPPRSQEPASPEEPESTPSTRPAEEILERHIEEEEKELAHRPAGLLLSGLSAGLDLGFGPLFMAIVLTMSGDGDPTIATRLLTANAYAVGYIFVVLGGSALFTEHTTLAVFPLLDRRSSVGEVARLWGLIYVGNLVGAALFALIGATIGPAMEIAEPWSFAVIAEEMVRQRWWVMMVSGVLTGWMLGLVAWLVASGRETISQVFFVWIVAVGIGFAGLHHCIAGTTEVLLGVFSGDAVSFRDYGRFLLWATIGNAIGGVVFVALVKYGQVARSTPIPRELGRS